MNKDMFKIGQKVSFPIFDDMGVIVFEYLGRGLNGFLKLDEGDEFVTISEEGNVEPFGCTVNDNKNRYSKMIGKLIHVYNNSGVDITGSINTYSKELLLDYLVEYIGDVDIPNESFVKLFNPDTNTISTILDEYNYEDHERFYDDDDD